MNDTLRMLIRQVDDDYLTGLSNKGTVKRAYKDLAQETPLVTWQEGAAKVQLKEVDCMIKKPLGESTCSCPSRSICRHVVTAILWLKQETGKSGEKEAEGAGSVPCESQPDTGSAPGWQKARPDSAQTAKENDSVQEPEALEEILRIPADSLKRACRGKRYQQFLAHLRAGELPFIEESSIVTVTIPWEHATVKLLEPFAYSTCTCHSRELCAHKAQAVLAYQLQKRRIAQKDLEALEETEQIWDMEQIRRTCDSVCEEMVHQLYTGLSRQSPEISEHLEQLAVISHRAELPALESMLREAASEYRQYFERSAAFRSEELFGKLLKIYRLAQQLQKASGQEQIRALAGNFRDTYEPAGQLHLLGMGARTFSSKTGYEGEIYYFLEPEQKHWYTWTDARPVFYEGVRRRPLAGSENVMAPWGLGCSRVQLQSLEFNLINAKAASGGRLSVSRESRGEPVGERSICSEAVRKQIFWNYETLLLKHFGNVEEGEEKEIQNRASGRREKLVLAGAVRWDETDFDTVEQRFSWSLYDREGRRLFISLKYTKEEKLTVQLLERLQKRLQKHSRKAVIFFGSVYLDESGRLCLYPIEFFIKEAEEIAEQEGLTDAWNSRKEDCEDTVPAKERQEHVSALSEEILIRMEQYRAEAARQLSDLFVSGLCSVQEDTIRMLSGLSEDGERMGLHYAGTAFAGIREELEKRRHRIEYPSGPVLWMAGGLEMYLRMCKKKLSCDMALLAMRNLKTGSKGRI